MRSTIINFFTILIFFLNLLVNIFSTQLIIVRNPKLRCDIVLTVSINIISNLYYTGVNCVTVMAGHHLVSIITCILTSLIYP